MNEEPKNRTSMANSIDDVYSNLSQPLFHKRISEDIDSTLMLSTFKTPTNSPPVPISSQPKFFSWLMKTRFKRAVICLSSISISRVMLYLPYIIYLCGLGNLIVWIGIITSLYMIKTSSILRASQVEGSQNLQILMKRSYSKTSFLLMTFCIVMATITDYMYLVL